jgi:hypothetical protein
MLTDPHRPVSSPASGSSVPGERLARLARRRRLVREELIVLLALLVLLAATVAVLATQWLGSAPSSASPAGIHVAAPYPGADA